MIRWISKNLKRKRQRQGLFLGGGAVILLYGWLVWPSHERCVVLGPLNTGHEELKCSQCHVPSTGTALQQIKANIMYTLGMRKSPVTFGYQDVTNQQCKNCHKRPNDRHPVHRFLEPKFEEARTRIHPEQCESCHREHQGVRVTLAEVGYCKNCHAQTALKHDPLDIPHEVLIKYNAWTTCLQCHDFHGNHVRKTATSLQDTIPMQKIKQYFLGGHSPYGDKKMYTAAKTPFR